MANIIVPSRWMVKPPVSARINWGHPSSLGLRWAFPLNEGAWGPLASIPNYAAGGWSNSVAKTITSKTWSASSVTHCTWNTGTRNGLFFDGDITANIVTDVANDFTYYQWTLFFCFVYYDAAPSFAIIADNLVGGGSRSIDVRVGDAGSGRYSLMTKHYNSASLWSNFTLTNNTWYTVALTRKGSDSSGYTYNFWLDGVKDSDLTSASAMQSPGFYYAIGRLGQYAGYYMNGGFSYFFAWDRPLGDPEVANLFKDPFAIYSPKSRLLKGGTKTADLPVSVSSTSSTHYGTPPNNVGSFSGAMLYSAQSTTYGQLAITVTNTTDPSARGSIVAFGIGNPNNRITDVSVIYNNTNFDLIGGPTYQAGIDCSNATTNYGNADIGMSIIGNTWNCPGVPAAGPRAGLRAGQTGTVVLGLTGTNMSALTTAYFKSTKTSGTNPVFFPVHFRWLNDNDINATTTNGDDITSSFLAIAYGGSSTSKIIGRSWASKPVLSSRINWSHPSTIGLRYAFVFNENNGLVAINKAYPNGVADSNPVITGTVDAAVLREGDKHITFDGTASCRITLLGDSATSGKVTCLFKFRPADISTFRGIISDSAASYVDASFTMDILDSGKVEICHNSGTAVTSNKVLATNTWYTVCGVRAGTTGSWPCSIYVDGVLDATATSSSNPTAPSTNMYIGSYGVSTGQNFIGSIEYVYLWDRVLSDSEIKTLTVRPYQIFCPPRSVNRGK